jgi:glyoxylase-like metal-dependent hydrolase (beta-lactamase superfamily II)
MNAYIEDIRKNKNPETTDLMPGVEIYHFRDNVYSLYQRSPGLGGAPWMHLIIGPEKALLFDTGFGIGDLKAVVEKLTDKPLYVVNSHFHGDHTLGNFQFDKVYIHTLDEPYLKDSMTPDANKQFVGASGDYYTADDIVKFKPYEIVTVEDGYVFDLGGGYTLEVAHLPGHAPGGIGLIDKQNRILFSGDALVSTPTMVCSGMIQPKYNPEQMTVTAFRDKLIDLIGKMDQFDVLVPGHAICDYPAKVVTDMKEACDEIIADPNCQTDMGTSLGNSSPTVKLKVVGLASIAYTDDRV